MIQSRCLLLVLGIFGVLMSGCGGPSLTVETSPTLYTVTILSVELDAEYAARVQSDPDKHIERVLRKKRIHKVHYPTIHLDSGQSREIVNQETVEFPGYGEFEQGENPPKAIVGDLIRVSVHGKNHQSLRFYAEHAEFLESEEWESTSAQKYAIPTIQRYSYGTTINVEPGIWRPSGYVSDVLGKGRGVLFVVRVDAPTVGHAVD